MGSLDFIVAACVRAGTFAGSAAGREAGVTGHAGEGAVRVGAHAPGTGPRYLALVHVCRPEITPEKKKKKKKKKKKTNIIMTPWR